MSYSNLHLKSHIFVYLFWMGAMVSIPYSVTDTDQCAYTIPRMFQNLVARSLKRF